jgi:hypothetical protein
MSLLHETPLAVRRMGLRSPTTRTLLGAAAAAWVVLTVARRGGGAVPTHASHETTGLADAGVVDPWSLAWLTGWLLMVVAMMWPLAVPTVGAVHRSAFPAWRTRLDVVCIATVTVLWLVVGLAGASAARVLGVEPHSVRWQLAFVCLALVLFGSARRRRLLERCLRLPAIAPGGRRGLLTAARAGVLSWRRCVVLCGPLMLAMTVGHSLALMAGASLAVWWEAWHPRTWRDPVPVVLVAAAGCWVLLSAAMGGGAVHG